MQHQSSLSFAPTRAQGMSRLQAFVPRAGRDYQCHRNTDFGSGRHRNVSTLSPYVRHRLIGEQEVLATVLDAHTPSEAFKFVQEVFWRGYWKGWMEHRGMLWDAYQQDLVRVYRAVEKDPWRWEQYNNAMQGATPIGPFNDWVNELRSTGYVHNHARMWMASIWVFTFNLPWQLGADFFFRHLCDGDPASNTLGWRWVAGLHTPGKTYLATASNIRKCAGERISDPCNHSTGLNRLATTAIAPLEQLSVSALQTTQIHWPGPLGGCAGSTDALGRIGMMVTEEDLDLHLPHPPQALAALSATPRSPVAQTSDLVQDFLQGALADTLRRGSLEHADSLDTWAAEPMDEQVLAEWFAQQGIKTVVHAYVPCGPTRMRLGRLTELLAARGIALVPFMRDYDRLVWPHATKGFFQLGKRIPDFLATMKLAHG